MLHGGLLPLVFYHVWLFSDANLCRFLYLLIALLFFLCLISGGRRFIKHLILYFTIIHVHIGSAGGALDLWSGTLLVAYDNVKLCVCCFIVNGKLSRHGWKNC